MSHSNVPPGSNYPDLPSVRGFSRRQYGELHAKDQAVKTSKKLQIEANWGVDVQECLPEDIRPKCEIKKGSKARVGDAVIVDEVWWNWSVELLKCIEELSSMTVNDIEYARTLLTIEVNHRHENPKSAQRKIAELLLGDAQRVVDDTRKKANNRANQITYSDNDQIDEMDYSSDPYPVARTGGGTQANDMEDEEYEGYEQFANEGAGDYDFSPNPDNGANAADAGRRRASQPQQNPHGFEALGNTYQSLGDQLKTTELKARAARLRAEAARVEAQATQLEMLAMELRERIEAGEE